MALTFRQMKGMTFKQRKEAIFERDNYRCFYCGKPLARLGDRKMVIENGKKKMIYPEGLLQPTLDHVVPRSKGGKFRPNNLVASCQPCNISKGNKDMAVFLAEVRNA